MTITYLYLPLADVPQLAAAYSVANGNEQLGQPRLLTNGITTFALFGSSRATSVEVAAMQATVPGLQASASYPAHLSDAETL